MVSTESFEGAPDQDGDAGARLCASRSGVVHALRNLWKMALQAQSASAQDGDALRAASAAIDAVQDLLASLPEGHEVASALYRVYSDARQINDLSAELGRADALDAMRLRRMAGKVEDALNRCRSASLSSDPAAVNVASVILAATARNYRHRHPAADYDLAITRGDCIGAHFLGATLACVMGGGRRIELSLRRAHPAIDGDDEPVQWRIEGLAREGQGRVTASVDETVGVEVGLDETPTVLQRHLTDLARSFCSIHAFPARKGR